MKVGDLRKYKEALSAASSRDLADFEKNFFYVAVGILAFSITFIKDIIKIPQATCFFLLWLSWILICTSIAIMLFAFLASSTASEKIWTIADDYLMQHELFDDESVFSEQGYLGIKTQINKQREDSAKSLHYQRIAAIIFFVAGIILFGSFVGINLYRESTASPVKKQVEMKTKNKSVRLQADSVLLNVNDSITLSIH